MALLQTQTQQQKIFAAVFPRGSVRPPKSYQRFEEKANALAKQAEETLQQGSRIILGIGDENFVFGGPAENQNEDVDYGDAYRTIYVNSCPMSSLPDSALASLLDQEGRKWDTFRLWSLAGQWTREIGGERIRCIFAKVLESCITEFVNWSYAGVYEMDDSESQSEVVPHLRFWVGNIFTGFVVKFLRAVRAAEGGDKNAKAEVTEEDVKSWEDVAITRLGALRVSELFDIVVDWDATRSGIDDLRHYTTNPATRTFVTSSFITVLQTRLLQPGASTVEILQLYISIIRAFRRLDPKGVLLDRIARVIRRNLRERDDTVRVIVSGLLSDTVDENGEPLPSDSDTLTELAVELNRHDEDTPTNDADLDWDNMEWMPDPIDAAPDYMKSKNTDVIGSLISLFDSKEVFVKELQVSLAERLLKKKNDYDQEVSVLEHLKLRFGSSSLQACEVMLRDVLDSRKVDNVIRQDQGMGIPTHSLSPIKGLTTAPELESEPQFHSKILSRLFWPTLQDQPFSIPAPILAAQSRYEAGFESLKQSRKLTWLNVLGHVEVELDLKDRIFTDDVLPWQAAVIYAFQDESGAEDVPVSCSVSQLAEKLSMSPTLVRSACIFWLSKRILHQPSSADPDTFTVLETLPDASTSASATTTAAQPAAFLAAAAEVAAAQAAKEAGEEERAGKLALYKQFIVSLLTNQGAMPVQRIKMMLGVVVPGGFGLGEEELRELLGGMAGEGRVEMGAKGVYRVVL
jgi:anaphase-promoting complex subunit 2